MYLLVSSTAVGLQLLLLYALGTAVKYKTKVCKDTVQDAPPNVKQELMMTALFSSVLMVQKKN